MSGNTFITTIASISTSTHYSRGAQNGSNGPGSTTGQGTSASSPAANRGQTQRLPSHPNSPCSPIQPYPSQSHPNPHARSASAWREESSVWQTNVPTHVGGDGGRCSAGVGTFRQTGLLGPAPPCQGLGFAVGDTAGGGYVHGPQAAHVGHSIVNTPLDPGGRGVPSLEQASSPPSTMIIRVGADIIPPPSPVQHRRAFTATSSQPSSSVGASNLSMGSSFLQVAANGAPKPSQALSLTTFGGANASSSLARRSAAHEGRPLVRVGVAVGGSGAMGTPGGSGAALLPACAVNSSVATPVMGRYTPSRTPGSVGVGHLSFPSAQHHARTTSTSSALGHATPSFGASLSSCPTHPLSSHHHRTFSIASSGHANTSALAPLRGGDGADGCQSMMDGSASPESPHLVMHQRAMLTPPQLPQPVNTHSHTSSIQVRSPTAVPVLALAAKAAGGPRNLAIHNPYAYPGSTTIPLSPQPSLRSPTTLHDGTPFSSRPSTQGSGPPAAPHVQTARPHGGAPAPTLASGSSASQGTAVTVTVGGVLLPAARSRPTSEGFPNATSSNSSSVFSNADLGLGSEPPELTHRGCQGDALDREREDGVSGGSAQHFGFPSGRAGNPGASHAAVAPLVMGGNSGEGTPGSAWMEAVEVRGQSGACGDGRCSAAPHRTPALSPVTPPAANGASHSGRVSVGNDTPFSNASPSTLGVSTTVTATLASQPHNRQENNVSVSVSLREEASGPRLGHRIATLAPAALQPVLYQQQQQQQQRELPSPCAPASTNTDAAPAKSTNAGPLPHPQSPSGSGARKGKLTGIFCRADALPGFFSGTQSPPVISTLGAGGRTCHAHPGGSIGAPRHPAPRGGFDSSRNRSRSNSGSFGPGLLVLPPRAQSPLQYQPQQQQHRSHLHVSPSPLSAAATGVTSGGSSFFDGSVSIDDHCNNVAAQMGGSGLLGEEARAHANLTASSGLWEVQQRHDPALRASMDSVQMGSSSPVAAQQSPVLSPSVHQAHVRRDPHAGAGLEVNQPVRDSAAGVMQPGVSPTASRDAQNPYALSITVGGVPVPPPAVRAMVRSREAQTSSLHGEGSVEAPPGGGIGRNGPFNASAAAAQPPCPERRRGKANAVVITRQMMDRAS